MALLPSGAGCGVMLRHRAAAAACTCLTVDAAVAYCTPDGAVQIRPAECMKVRRF